MHDLKIGIHPSKAKLLLLFWNASSYGSNNPYQDSRMVNNRIRTQSGSIENDIIIVNKQCQITKRFCITSAPSPNVTGLYVLQSASVTPKNELSKTEFKQQTSTNPVYVVKFKTKWVLIRDLSMPPNDFENQIVSWDILSYSSVTQGAPRNYIMLPGTCPEQSQSAKTARLITVQQSSTTTWVLFVLTFGGALFIASVGKCHAMYARIDSYSAKPILLFAFNGYDFFSDVLLALTMISLLGLIPITMLCCLFIAFPLCVSVYQAFKYKFLWEQDSRIDTNYIGRYYKFLAIGTALSGSVFATAELLNVCL